MPSQKTNLTQTIQETTSIKKSRVPAWAVILVITAIAAGLRLYKLGYWSFWVDEIFTLLDSHNSSEQLHAMTYPLSFMLTEISLNRFGLNEWAARIVPAMFGIATPAMVYLLARKSFGELTAIIAAAIIAISPWHLYWSQMARFYTMTLFFSTASLLVFYKGLENNKKYLSLVAGILMGLAGASHYSALLMLLAIAFFGITIRLMKWTRATGSTAANWLIFFSPFILGAIVTGLHAYKLLSIYAKGHATGTVIVNPVKAAAYMIFSTGYRIEPAVLILAIIGAYIGLSKRNRGTLYLTTAVAVPCLALIVAGILSHAENRYAFVVLPAAAILAGSAASEICKSLWGYKKILALSVPMVIALPMLQHDASYFSSASNGERWNYKAAAEYLKTHASEGEPVYSTMYLPLDFYLRNNKLAVKDMNIGNIQNGLTKRRAWFIMEDATRGESTSRELSGWVSSHCQLEAHFSASSPVADYGLSVYQWMGKPDEAK